MTLRRTRQVLWITTVILVAATAGIVAWAITMPASVSVSAPVAPADPSSAAEVTPTALPSLGDLQRLASRPLRRPLYDPPPPPPPAPVVKAPPKLPIRLIGVAVEPVASRSTGMFAVGKNIELKRAGDVLETPVGEVSIAAVSSDSASVEFRGRSYTLEMPGSEQR